MDRVDLKTFPDARIESYVKSKESNAVDQENKPEDLVKIHCFALLFSKDPDLIYGTLNIFVFSLLYLILI
jgi:hypothetical protein